MANENKTKKHSNSQGRLVAALVIVLLLAIFAVLNVKAVTINFGFFSFQQPLIIVIVLMFLLGALVSWLLGRKH